MSGSILACYTIWAEFEVGDTTLDFLLMWLVEMSVENLFCVCEGSIESCLDNVDVFNVLLVVDEVIGLPNVLVDLRVAGDLRLGGGSESPDGTLGKVSKMVM